MTKNKSNNDLIFDRDLLRELGISLDFKYNIVAWQHIEIPIILYKSSYFDQTSLTHLCQLHPLYNQLYVTIQRCLHIDFLPLRLNNPKFENQMHIPTWRRWHFLSALIYYNAHIASIIRYCGGTYIAAFHNLDDITTKLSKMTSKYYQEVLCLYTIGAPQQLYGHSSRQNVLNYWRYGNHGYIKKIQN